MKGEAAVRVRKLIQTRNHTNEEKKKITLPMLKWGRGRRAAGVSQQMPARLSLIAEQFAAVQRLQVCRLGKKIKKEGNGKKEEEEEERGGNNKEGNR